MVGAWPQRSGSSRAMACGPTTWAQAAVCGVKNASPSGQGECKTAGSRGRFPSAPDRLRAGFGSDRTSERVSAAVSRRADLPWGRFRSAGGDPQMQGKPCRSRSLLRRRLRRRADRLAWAAETIADYEPCREVAGERAGRPLMRMPGPACSRRRLRAADDGGADAKPCAGSFERGVVKVCRPNRYAIMVKNI
jgi:hypothetical protein